jgi:hypothetical protein
MAKSSKSKGSNAPRPTRRKAARRRDRSGGNGRSDRDGRNRGKAVEESQLRASRREGAGKKPVERKANRNREESCRCKVEEMSTEKSKVQAEVDQNYEEFKKMLPTLLAAHRDQFALMKDGKILGYYSTAQDAAQAAEAFIKDGIFSIQEITDNAINLGFFTHAVPVNSVQP